MLDWTSLTVCQKKLLESDSKGFTNYDQGSLESLSHPNVGLTSKTPSFNANKLDEPLSQNIKSTETGINKGGSGDVKELENFQIKGSSITPQEVELNRK